MLTGRPYHCIVTIQRARIKILKFNRTKPSIIETGINHNMKLYNTICNPTNQSKLRFAIMIQFLDRLF